MRPWIKSSKGVLFLAAILSAWTTAAMAGISGTPHDFSSATGPKYNFSDQICVICHAPHNANPGDEPLWNHELTTATFTAYSSSTMDVSVGQPGGVSKLCLSCHDGTVAIDSFGGATGSNYISGSANLTTDLSDDHPVSIVWDHQTVSSGTPCSNCHFGGNPPPFYDGKVECASCHDPHDDIISPFLRETMSGSQLCLRCHEK
ncbi:cytochrome C [Candidatus Saccharibacteria bacterium]|nr:cytochrome C [Candidatus Saccharibacteria bacterium]